MLKYQLKSGRKVELSLAPVETALALYRTIMTECQNCKLDLSISEDMTMLDLLSKNSEVILKLMGSESVTESIKECCAKVRYNNEKFSMDLFEEEKARADFFGVMILVALENLLPFFPSLRTYSEMLLSLFLM